MGYHYKTYQIVTNNWAAAITVDPETNRVIETAPINKWMMGRHLTMIRNWVMKNRFRFIEIEKKEEEKDG